MHVTDLQRFFDRSLEPLCVLDQTGRFRFANPAFERMVGHSSAELTSQRFMQWVHPADREPTEAALQTAAKDGKSVRFEIRFRCQDDLYRWLAWSCPPPDEDDGLLYVAGRDVTDLKGVVRELSDHKRRLAAVLRTAVDGIITIDECGVVQSVNPAVEKIFGYASEEIIGQNVSKLMPYPYRDEHDSYIQFYVRTGQRKVIGIGREVEGQRKDGTMFPIDLALSETVFGDRRLFTGILRDITERKKANEELERRVVERTAELEATQEILLQKEKLATLGRVSGGIAHEIRNPLNAIKTSVYFLLHAKNPKPEKTCEHLQRIDRQVNLANNVITTLSDFAKLPAPEFAAFDVKPCFEEVVETSTIPEPVSVEFAIPEDIPRALADEHQILIALRNLLRNARDAMPDGGTIRLAARAVERDKVRVEVIDHGIGIPADKLDQIMEPLYSTKARGMGLGLAITRSIVENNQGRLSVSSAVGQGSTFTVELRAVPR